MILFTIERLLTLSTKCSTVSFNILVFRSFAVFPFSPSLESPVLLNPTALVTADSHSRPEEIVMCFLFFLLFLQILDFPQYCSLTRHIELKHGVWIVVNSIKMNLSKHLVCGFLHLRMQDVEEMTLRFSHFYSFMWLVMDFSNVAFQHPAPAAFGQKGTKGDRNKHRVLLIMKPYIYNNPWVFQNHKISVVLDLQYFHKRLLLQPNPYTLKWSEYLHFFWIPTQTCSQ